MRAIGQRRRPAGVIAALIVALAGIAIASTAIAQTTTAQSAGQPPAEPKPPDQAEPKPAAPPEAKPPPSAEPVVTNNADSVLGKKVIGPKGENLGLIVDVLVDTSGKPQAAVIDFGGFLGVGSRKIAIDWRLLDFSQLEHGRTVELGFDRAQIQAAPEYKPGKPSPAVVTTPPEPDATQKNP
ncbi:MAG TPA: PRC-barrel domain-containing protein [Stellaceae bacterium]|jgi:hypothetical protein